MNAEYESERAVCNDGFFLIDNFWSCNSFQHFEDYRLSNFLMELFEPKAKEKLHLICSFAMGLFFFGCEIFERAGSGGDRMAPQKSNLVE